MALAEALKSNTTVKILRSAARPLNPRPPMHFSLLAPRACTRSLHLPLFTYLLDVCAASRTTNLAPRLAWRLPRPSRATQPSIGSCLLPCHRIHSPMPLAPSACTLDARTVLHRPSPFAQAQQQRPRPQGWYGVCQGPREQRGHQRAPVCRPAIEPTRREHAAANHVPTPRVGRGHTLHCPTGGWREVRAPARLRLADNDIGNDAMRALTAAVSSSLKRGNSSLALQLHVGITRENSAGAHK